MVSEAPQLGHLASVRRPPISFVAMAVMSLVFAGGIDIAAVLPRRAALGPPVALLAVAGLLLVAMIVMIGRLQEFAWHVFWRVTGWAALAYVVIAGMIEYAIVYDGTRGSLLAVMTGLLLVFAVDVPLLLGFAVARYQEPKPSASERRPSAAL